MNSRAEPNAGTGGRRERKNETAGMQPAASHPQFDT